MSGRVGYAIMLNPQYCFRRVNFRKNQENTIVNRYLFVNIKLIIKYLNSISYSWYDENDVIFLFIITLSAFTSINFNRFLSKYCRWTISNDEKRWKLQIGNLMIIEMMILISTRLTQVQTYGKYNKFRKCTKYRKWAAKWPIIV